MIAWVISLGSVGTLGAIIWALIERSGRTGALADFERMVAERDKTAVERLAAQDRANRLEALVLDMKREVTLAEADLAACAVPGSIRSRLNRLLRAPSDGESASSVVRP